MFIKSKHKENEGVQNMSLCTPCRDIVTHDVYSDLTEWYLIIFYYSDRSTSWMYRKESDQIAEFKWIVSQLDCAVNDGKKEPAPTPPPNPIKRATHTNYI